jgi:ATP/maltotriose-dependent transcriptional regulator MalT
MVKKYLGRTTDLTLVRLEEIAAFLMAAESFPLREASAHISSDERVPDRLHLWATVEAPAVGADVTTVLPARASVHRDPLLSTKLHVPRPRAQLVQRSSLVQRLQQGTAGVLTLVSAPAGFGKTTLLTQWQASTRRPVAWLSLEAEDNDPTRFLSYLIAALQTLDAQIATTALAMLHTPQPAPPEVVLAMVANDLMSREAQDFTLVLDDYHLITADPIQRGMTYLVEHLPPQMHLLLATRAVPPFPLSRLRARGQLCDAVTGQEGSQAMLEALERANLFVVALDDERGCYRYHHLLDEVLLNHLQQREPTLPPLLHRGASNWYEQHALAVPDVELAARLIEPVMLRVAYHGQIYTVRGVDERTA